MFRHNFNAVGMSFTRRQWITTAALTAGCLGGYFVLRAVPVEACDFLHYGEFVNSAGVLEGCGFEETGFFDLDELRFPILVELEPLGELRAGQETLFQLSLQTSSGRILSYEDLAVSHTERLHAMIVDESLEDYQHIHPEPGGAPGTYVFSLTPRRSGDYSVFLDLIPLRTARRAFLHSTFSVPGETAPTERSEPWEQTLPDGFVVRMEPANGRFQAGAEVPFELTVESPAGESFEFQPVMDAFAHIVAFAPGRNGFAHFHPVNPFIDGQDPRNPDLDFVFSVDTPGSYRVWAQFSLNGEERFVPFDLQVESPG